MQSRAPRQIHFTKSAIESLTVPDKRQYYYDARTPGLAICVMPSGSKSFYVVRRVGVRSEKIRVGGWPETTIEQARDEAARINGKLADGINPADDRRASRNVHTLQEAFDVYITLPTRTKAKRPRSPKTIHDYKLQWAAYLAPWGHRRLDEVTKAQVEDLHNRLGEENGHYTANRALGLLRSIYNAAIESAFECSYEGPNPTDKIPMFEEKERTRSLEADELPKFWEALEAEPSEKIRDFVKVALFTGQRRANVLAMKWAELNLDRGTWSMLQTKTGKHEIPLPGVVLEVLRRRWANRLHDGPVDGNTGEHAASEYVFPGLHGAGHLTDPMRAWRDILTRAGIDNLRIHDLRHSLASWQVNTGSSLAVIGKTLGHRRAETTRRYAHVARNPVLESMTTAAAAIMAAAKPPKKPRQTKKPRRAK